MDTHHPDYSPLTVETLSARLSTVNAITERIGTDFLVWKVREVGDGNLNLVFIVEGTVDSIVVKQALPYVRLVGDSWPLPLKRSYFEYHALMRQAERDPGSVPEIFYFSEEQAILAMEFIAPHTILRGKLINGDRIEGLASTLGKFCARTAFKGSDLYMETADRKADAGRFLDNVALCGITENLVFTDPYCTAEMNHHTAGLESVVSSLRADVELKTRVQHMMMRFTANAETLCHGDLHTGSVMCTDTEARIIDPEFAFYGPMGFDLGMLLANFLMSYFSQPAHRLAVDLESCQEWILTVIEDIHEKFTAEFTNLWKTERAGILYPQTLFEDQGHSSLPALADKLVDIWQDAVGFCGIEMHRRILSLAHNADFETIDDTQERAPLEARNLAMGCELILNTSTIKNAEDMTSLARDCNSRDIL